MNYSTQSNTDLHTLDIISDPARWNRGATYNQVLEMGYPAFLVQRENKKPFAGTRGFYDATTHLDVIDSWLARYGNQAMPAIPTGQASGLMIWDMDCKKGKDGMASLRELEERIGEKLPWKYVVKTPNGYHAYFQLRQGQSFPCSVSTVADGIDIRCENGYAVAEGAINAEGKMYRAIIAEEIPYLPEAFVTVLTETTKEKKRKLFNDDGVIPEGMRNQNLFLIVAMMRAKGLEGQKLLELALWANTNLCSPSLSEDEVQRIVQSAETYAASYTHDMTGYAERFADKFSAVLKCIDRKFWYVWNGRIWLKNEVATYEYAKQLAKEIDAISKAYVAKDDKDNLKDSLEAHAKKVMQNPLAVVPVAASDPKIARSIDEFDSHPLLINTQNCIVDLMTGEALPHDAKWLMTKCARVNYVPDARSVLWDDLLSFYTDGNKEVETYLARIFGGLGLIDGNPAQVMLILSGGSGNAKSTVVSSIEHTMGDYTDVLRHEVLLGNSQMRDFRHDIADLIGARLVLTSEPPQGGQLNCGFIKGFTGNDTLKGRHNYGESVTFKSSGLIVLTTNWEPELPHGDPAMHRRIQIYRHDTSIAENKRDLSLPEKLKQPEHAEAIFAWLVRGRLDYLKQGLNPPALIQEQIQDYIATKDLFSAFLKEKCVQDPEARTQAEPLFAAYQKFCHEAEGTWDAKARKFYELAERKFGKKRIKGKTFYCGVALLNG